MTVTTLEDLREHLQWAIELEHATIPPYLCALYSIKPGQNRGRHARHHVGVHRRDAAHDAGGQPAQRGRRRRRSSTNRVSSRGIRRYLPHSANAFLVPLAPFSPAAIETFMKIEKPEEGDAPAEADRLRDDRAVLSRDRGRAEGALRDARREAGVLAATRRGRSRPTCSTTAAAGAIVAGGRPRVGARGDR